MQKKKKKEFITVLKLHAQLPIWRPNDNQISWLDTGAYSILLPLYYSYILHFPTQMYFNSRMTILRIMYYHKFSDCNYWCSSLFLNIEIFFKVSLFQTAYHLHLLKCFQSFLNLKTPETFNTQSLFLFIW